MEKYTAYNHQNRNLLMGVINMMLALSGKLKGFEANPSVQTGVALHYNAFGGLVPFGKELVALNQSIQQYALDYLSLYLTSLKKFEAVGKGNSPPLSGDTEMIAELGRMTTRILLGIKKKQLFLESFSQLMQINRTTLPPEQAELVLGLQKVCAEYYLILNRLYEQIHAFSTYTGRILFFRNSLLKYENDPGSCELYHDCQAL